MPIVEIASLYPKSTFGPQLQWARLLPIALKSTPGLPSVFGQGLRGRMPSSPLLQLTTCLELSLLPFQHPFQDFLEKHPISHLWMAMGFESGEGKNARDAGEGGIAINSEECCLIYA